MPDTDEARRARALLLLMMAVWGLNLSAIKVLTGHFEPLLVAVLRMSVACLVLWAAMLWQRTSWPVFTVRRVMALCACAVCMVYGNQILLADGLVRTGASNAALIMALSPLVSMLLAAIFLRERLTPRRLAGLVLGFGGVAAVTLSRPAAGWTEAGLGDLQVFAAIASFCAGGLIVQRLSGAMTPLALAGSMYTLGAVLLLLHLLLSPVSLTAGKVFPGVGPWSLIVFSGAMATAWGALLWNRGIAVLGATRTAQFQYWVPIFGVGFAALFLGEPLTVWHAFGLAAVIAGNWLGTRPAR